MRNFYTVLKKNCFIYNLFLILHFIKHNPSFNLCRVVQPVRFYFFFLLKNTYMGRLIDTYRFIQCQ